MPKYKSRTFAGTLAVIRPVTKNHRIAVWEGILGTVYAMNERGTIKYFDYDWDGARTWAGLDKKKDLRLARNKEHSGSDYRKPAKNKLVLYCERS